MIVEREIIVTWVDGLDESTISFHRSAYTPPAGTGESVTLIINMYSPKIKKYQANPDKYEYTWNFWVESSGHVYGLDGKLRSLVEVRMKRVKEFVKRGEFKLRRMYQFSYDEVTGKTPRFLEKFAAQNLRKSYI